MLGQLDILGNKEARERRVMVLWVEPTSGAAALDSRARHLLTSKDVIRGLGGIAEAEVKSATKKTAWQRMTYLVVSGPAALISGVLRVLESPSFKTDVWTHCTLRAGVP